MLLKPSAFTLPEMLLAVAVFAIFMLVAATCVQLAGRSFTASQRQLQSIHTARNLARVILNDCRHAVPPFHLNPPPSITPITDKSQNANSDALFFFTNHPTAGQSGICAVGYYLDGGGTLRRYYQNSRQSWQDGMLPHLLDQSKPLFPIISGGREEEPLAANIPTLHIRPLRADSTAPTPWPPQEKPALVEFHIVLQEPHSPARELRLTASCQ